MSNPNEDKSEDTIQYDLHLMGTVVRMPMVVDRAVGSVIHPVGQPGLLDFWGDEGVCSLGYNTKPVQKALIDFLATNYPHQLPDVYPHPARWEAAEMLCSRTGMDKVFFANSGTEANEAAIKLARKYWWDQESEHASLIVGTRHRILTLEGNFHGRTGHSSAASDYRVSPYHRHGFGPTPEGYGVLSEGVTPGWGHFRQVVTDGIEHEPRKPDWDAVAAIIMAPVLGNNVVDTYPRRFWRELEAIRADHGVLLIYDDVQAGSGRSGHYASWQHDDCQLKPDIMTLAKGMAMGYPMSAMFASENIAASFTPGTHFNTFGGSPFMCWMASRMIEWLDGNLDRVREVGYIIRRAFDQRPWIEEYDGWGMLNAFTPNWAAHGYDGFQFIREARRHGLSLVTHRQYGPLRFTPPLNVTDADLMKAFMVLDLAHGALTEVK